MTAFFVKRSAPEQSTPGADAGSDSRAGARISPAPSGLRLEGRPRPARVAARMPARVSAWLMSGLLAMAWASWPGIGIAQSDSADELLSEAQQALNAGKPGQTESLLNKAIKQTPDNADFYLLRSRARESLGKYKAALEDASKYIELLPQEAYGYLNRAHIHLSLEKPQEALADANQAIALEPEEPDGYYRRADVYQLLGKTAEAKADEAKAEELSR